MKTIFCLAQSHHHAERILGRLQGAGIKREFISYVSPKTQEDLRKKEDLLAQATQGGTTGAVTGGVIGGSLGLLAGLGAFAIPGLGPIIAAGPILGALSGSALGGSLGLFIGALINIGVPELLAKKYESSIREGKILLSVETNNDSEADKVIENLKKESATDISSVISKEKKL